MLYLVGRKRHSPAEVPLFLYRHTATDKHFTARNSGNPIFIRIFVIQKSLGNKECKHAKTTKKIKI